MDNRIQACAPVMERICAEYRDDPDAQLLDLMNEGNKHLAKHNLLTENTVHSTKTVVHPRNRSGGMLEVSQVPNQVADISDVAFDWSQVQNACAVRMPACGSKERKEIEITRLRH